MLPTSRRHFLQGSLAAAGVGLLLGCGFAPHPGPASAKISRIGFLSEASPLPSAANPSIGALRQGLRELGWIEGENLMIEFRLAEGKLDHLPALAADLVRLEVALIHAANTPAAKAARQATTTIPIVIATAADPVAEGLVASLSSPGSNVTGLSSIHGELIAKRVQLLKEVVPGASRIGVLMNPTLAGEATCWGFLREVEAGARASGVQLQYGELRNADDLDNAFSTIVRERPDAMVVLPDPVSLFLRAEIAEHAIQHRLAAIGATSLYAEAGLLLAYGANTVDLHRRSAVHVDKLLRGASPTDLPVERPTKFDYVINLRTAQALGLTVAQSALLQATEVIQ